MAVETNELRNMTKEELHLKMDSLREEIFRLTYAVKSGNLGKPHRINEVRRDIARCKTILREKEIEKNQP